MCSFSSQSNDVSYDSFDTIMLNLPVIRIRHSIPKLLKAYLNANQAQLDA